MKSLALVFACVVIGVAGQLLLKNGMAKIGRIDSSTLANPLTLLAKMASHPVIIAAIALYVVGMFLWLVVLSRESLSFAYPLLGLSYVLIVFASKLFLDEPVTLMRFIGAATISLGVVIITRN